MRSLLVHKTGYMNFKDLPPEHRHSVYQEVANPRVPVSPTAAELEGPVVYETRTFHWRMTVMRKNGDHLFDLFEEM